MKTIVAGIDLGTTNSVIAVPGQYPDKGEVFGPVTVLKDDFGRMTQASAICLFDGEVIVGDDAKERASEGYTPIRFVKKYMGTTERFRLGERMLSPEEFSAIVLRHMVGIAEKALGMRITEAVVTHPAYFDGGAIKSTKDAADLAKLGVDGRLTMEPVAAAMAYTSEDERPNLRVLVYDLGGGTFDVTLVDRTGGAFRPVGCGGDRELGGYNFDKKIASEMLKAIRSKGYVLDIPSDHPEQDARWASLMHHAEQVKLGLSTKIKADVRIPGAFRDDSSPPKAVNLSYSLTRPEFLALIEPELEKTMRQTREVLDKAKLTAADIDYLVLVGGSCRIPAIQERLKKEFGENKVQYDEDVLDLSVAVGAAMIAMSAGTTENGVTIGSVPAVTDEESLAIDGTVLPIEGRPKVADIPVIATGGASGASRTMTSDQGKFFLEVELRKNTENHIELRVGAEGPSTLLLKTFKVTHDPNVAPPPPPPQPILPKPISVDTVSGLSEIAKEGLPLPYRNSVALETTDELNEIFIDLFQEDVQLCRVLLKDFPHPVPANCLIDLEVFIEKDYSMTVTARVPSAEIEKSQKVVLPKLVVPTADELRLELDQTRKVYQERLDNAPAGAQKVRVAAECEQVIDEAELLLANEHPERMQIYMLIKRLYLLANQLPSGGILVPPKDEMDELFETALELLPQALAKKASLKEQGFDQTIEALRLEKDRAYQKMNATSWAHVAERVNEIVNTLSAVVSGGGGGGATPPAAVLALMVLKEIAEIESALAAKRSAKAITPADADRCAGDLAAARDKLQKVNMTDEDAARSEIVKIYQAHVEPAHKLLQIGGAKGPGDGPVVKRAQRGTI